MPSSNLANVRSMCGRPLRYLVDWQWLVLLESESAMGKRVQHLPEGNGHVQEYAGILSMDVNPDTIGDR